MALMRGRDGRSTALFGGFWTGQTAKSPGRPRRTGQTTAGEEEDAEEVVIMI